MLSRSISLTLRHLKELLSSLYDSQAFLFIFSSSSSFLLSSLWEANSTRGSSSLSLPSPSLSLLHIAAGPGEEEGLLLSLSSPCKVLAFFERSLFSWRLPSSFSSSLRGTQWPYIPLFARQKREIETSLPFSKKHFCFFPSFFLSLFVSYLI